VKEQGGAVRRLTQHSTFRRAQRSVVVIGSGYVGLTAAACLAQLGHDVHCTDVLTDRVKGLRGGHIPIVEQGLAELVRSGLATGRLTFGTDNVAAVRGAEIVFLCVPTPQGEDGTADLSFITGAVTEIACHLRSGAIVVTKSTVPVGSSRVVSSLIDRDDVNVVSNPEFLREGSAVNDFLRPDRVVVGADSEDAALRVAALYGRLGARVVLMDPESAELVKYASNSFLATKISFINSVSSLCEELGADIRHVADGVGLDSRIGSQFMEPGPGWGGSCFPKDSAALLRMADDVGFDFGVLRAAVQANEHHRNRIVDRISALAGGCLEGRVVALWGLTFKANTDDRRRSPAIAIADHLVCSGARVQAYDPTVDASFDGIHVLPSAWQACDGAEVLVVATEWDEFRSVNLHHVGARMARRALLDARNLLDESAALKAGFVYEGVGFTACLDETIAVSAGAA
jgi:UDPglucose 6-dehydrogenase